MKKKLKIEYPLNPTSGIIIWNAISTPAGLERWFADKVTRSGKTYTFRWGKNESRDADITNTRSEYFIRFHWKDDEEPKSFFELKILFNELTSDHILEITDFADPDEEEDTINLWNSQIDVLRRVFGV
ncbi:SRPBCC domain-containing protein [Bacteroides caecigallinarum]|uniref:START-like domain-containing protein n=2 Tax=Bacteroides caecigallinarum TaxID=1411144 RepID=UPI001955FCDB|nr:START-like domain-containing protein [Bacteroides caecigallinarum]MBM6883045.1 SRPBCC domain-containing protein [Bacteroides caecigallinarum]MBM6889375.1 SRPBCC domain-containing protein [Bacteroides caecigallinarum]